MIMLKQSSAADIVVGPFVDDTDGKTPEAGLTISQADCQISKNGGAMAQKNSTTAASHLGGGHYKIPLNTTDTNTLGVLRLYVNESGALPVWVDCMIMAENAWNSLFGSDRLQVDVLEISGDSAAADNLESYCDGTTPIPANATQIEGSDATNQINAACDSALADYDAPTKAEMDAGFAALNDFDPDTENVTVGNPNDCKADVSALATSAALATVDSNVDAVKLKTDNLPSDPADQSAVEAAIAAAHTTTDGKVDAVQADLDNPNQFKADVSALATSAALATVDSNVDAIKATTDKLDDTLELDSTEYRFTENALEQAPSGTGASAASIADAVWDEAIADHASAGTFGAKNQKVVPSESAEDYKADVSGLSTFDAATDNVTVGNPNDCKADVSGLATSAEISALNDVSEAQVNAQVDAALADYDAPTKAEMDAGFAALNDFDPDTENVTVGNPNDCKADVSNLATSAEIAALNDPAASEIADAVWDEAQADHTAAGSMGESLDDAGSGGSVPTADEVADAVWDEAATDHLTAGSTGAALNAAGSAGDPWTTPLPGSYGDGTAGKLVSGLDTKLDTFNDSGTVVSSSSISEDNELTLTRGDRIEQAISGISDAVLSATKVWVTCKYDRGQNDSEAIFQIEKTGGLLYLNGAAVTESPTTKAGITLRDDGDGTATVTFTLEAAQSAQLPIKKCWWDVQYLTATDTDTPRQGQCTIENDVTRATS